MEDIPQSFIALIQFGLSIALYVRILLLADSFDFHPSSQYSESHSQLLPSCKYVFVPGAARDTLHLLIEEGVRCLYGLVGRFLFMW
jgi:hypothetical protein